MAGEIVTTQASVDPRRFDMREVIGGLLPRGHVVHGFSSALGERVMAVQADRDYSDEAALLGYGVDGTAERALARALLTYAMRERDGLEQIDATHYPETEEGAVLGGSHKSRFDNIVWSSGFKLYQAGSLVVARSSYGGGYGLEPLEVTAPDAFEAITGLADKYHFVMPSTQEAMSRLPAISLE